MLFDEARRQLDQQAAVLDALRTRAATVLGISGVIAGLFVGRVLPGHLGWAAWTAIALFGVATAATITVVVPRDYFAFSENLDKNLDWYDRHGQHPDAARVFLVGLTKNMADDRSRNVSLLRRITRWFTLECVLLGGQLLFWAVALAVD